MTAGRGLDCRQMNRYRKRDKNSGVRVKKFLKTEMVQDCADTHDFRATAPCHRGRVAANTCHYSRLDSLVCRIIPIVYEKENVALKTCF